MVQEIIIELYFDCRCRGDNIIMTSIKHKRFTLPKYSPEILCFFSTDRSTTTLWYTDHREEVIHCTPIVLMNHFCMYCGSTFKGKNDAIKIQYNVRHKLPISIYDNGYNTFFPTRGYENHEVMWISLTHIESIERERYGEGCVHFRNGKELVTNCSYETLISQRNFAGYISYMLLYTKNYEFQKQKRYEYTIPSFEPYGLVGDYPFEHE